MSRAALDAIARAVLYEGFVLYPYRPSSVKNRRRFPMGGLFPPAYCASAGDERAALSFEMLLEGGPEARLSTFARFLQLVEGPRAPSGEPWHEARERETGAISCALADALAEEERGLEGTFAFGTEGTAAARPASLRGRLTLSAEEVAPRLHRVCVRLENVVLDPTLRSREAALLRALASPHVVLEVEGGALVSAIDPPAALATEAARCRREGAFPVLVGPRGSRSCALASPIILHDWPETAPESPGDLFDATEIDEILTLRILTLTDDEKREARAIDPRARALLDRTEALAPEALARLHGAIRERRPIDPPLPPGAKVKIRPRRRADALDVALAGRTATVASVERDFEGRLHYALTVDDDPGADLGRAGFPGHRFFYGADELEPLS